MQTTTSDATTVFRSLLQHIYASVTHHAAAARLPGGSAVYGFVEVISKLRTVLRAVAIITNLTATA